MKPILAALAIVVAGPALAEVCQSCAFTNATETVIVPNRPYVVDVQGSTPVPFIDPTIEACRAIDKLANDRTFNSLRQAFVDLDCQHHM